MVKLPPYTFVAVNDPVLRDDKGELIYDEHKQVKLKHGDAEIRTSLDFNEPFPLYPGESSGQIGKLTTVPRNYSIKLEALRDFNDAKSKRVAGDQWLEKGPIIYIPRVEVDIVKIVKPWILKTDQAIKVRALKATKDYKGVERKAGEEWLIRDPGFYQPNIDEELVEILDAAIIDEKTALHFRAIQTFKDAYGVVRKAGEEWIVTSELTSSHIADVYETLIDNISITILTQDNYGYVLNPLDEKTGLNQWGNKILHVGPKAFFLRPGEELEGGIKTIYVLEESEALLLKAEEAFVEEINAKKTERNAGDKWMVNGPCRYIPPVEVTLLDTRHAIPLDKNEGIYVRDTRNGSVRAVSG